MLRFVAAGFVFIYLILFFLFPVFYIFCEHCSHERPCLYNFVFFSFINSEEYSHFEKLSPITFSVPAAAAVAAKSLQSCPTLQ